MGDPLGYEKQVAYTRWADRYTARFEQELTAAWPDLADRLRDAIGPLSWAELTLGPGKDFHQTRIAPAVGGWVERHVRPIIEDAAEEFRCISQTGGQGLHPRPLAEYKGERALHALDVVKGLALPAGLLLGGGAVTTAITTATTWFIFTTVVVNWPLLIAGLTAGVVLSWFGVVNVAGLQRDLQDRFQKRLLPKIRDAAVATGTRPPSLKDQLQRQVREQAEAARGRLDK